MRTRYNILLATIAVAICTIAASTTASAIDNGWEQIPNVNDPMVQGIGRWAVAEHVRQAGDGFQFRRVVSGLVQVVSPGKNFKLRVDAVNPIGQEGMYIAQVYDQPWNHTRTLDFFGLED